MVDQKELIGVLERIARALEHSNGLTAPNIELDQSDAFVWDADGHRLHPVTRINRVDYSLLQGIGHVKKQLLENTLTFALGYSANNVLLWGARGMGKSSAVKAVHAKVLQEIPQSHLKLIELHREDIDTLPLLLNALRDRPEKIILFCDDLSFDHGDTSYKSLKAALDGGLEGRPDNVLFYATSNRRHLLPRDMMENERSTAINPSEAIEEKVSLSDRFGLWLGFHKCDQEAYLAMVQGYADHFHLAKDKSEHEALGKKALEWATTRGARSGRVAWQFIQSYAGSKNRKL